MASQAEIDILRAKFKRVLNDPVLKDHDYSTQKPHKRTGFTARYKDIYTDAPGSLDAYLTKLLEEDSGPENISHSELNHLCDCYENIPKFLDKIGIKNIPPYLQSDNHHALKDCKLPFFLETARFFGADDFKPGTSFPDDINNLVGKYYYFQNCSIPDHTHEISVSIVEILRTLVDEFLIVNRTFTNPDNKLITYQGLLFKTGRGMIIMFFNDENRAPHICCLRKDFNLNGGFFSAQMLKHSTMFNGSYTGNVVYKKITKDTDFAYEDNKLYSHDEIENHDQHIYKILADREHTLPRVETISK